MPSMQGSQGYQLPWVGPASDEEPLLLSVYRSLAVSSKAICFFKCRLGPALEWGARISLVAVGAPEIWSRAQTQNVVTTIIAYSITSRNNGSGVHVHQSCSTECCWNVQLNAIKKISDLNILIIKVISKVLEWWIAAKLVGTPFRNKNREGWYVASVLSILQRWDHCTSLRGCHESVQFCLRLQEMFQVSWKVPDNESAVPKFGDVADR